MNAQVQQLVTMMRAAAPATPMWELSPADARRQFDAYVAALNAGGPEMAETRDLTVAGRRGPIARR